jgi:hypothetical protein
MDAGMNAAGAADAEGEPTPGRPDIFASHPTGAAPIAEIAAELERECAALDQQTATIRPTGFDPDADPAAVVRRHTDDIMRRVTALLGSIRAYGTAIARYDERIERLNARWVAANRRGFGVPPVSTDPEALPGDVAAADQDQADQVWQARAGVAMALRTEYEYALADLEAASMAFDHAAGPDRMPH